MKSRRRRALQAFLAWLTIAFCRGMRCLPFPVARRVGRMAGRLAYYAVPRIRKVGLANVARALGTETARRDGRRLVRMAAENVGMVAAEFSSTHRLRDARFREKYLRIEGLEHLSGGPCVAVGAHLGNWEWIGPALAQLGFSGAEVVRPLDNPRLNAYVDAVRRSGGIDTLPKDGAGVEMLRRLRRGQIVGILADQSPRDNGVPVAFFGTPCWATVAPAMAALLGNVPIHLGSLTREPDGRLLFAIQPALELSRTGDRQADLLENTQRCQHAVEELIRVHPEQWLWFHRRWKERPKLERQWQARQDTSRGN